MTTLTLEIHHHDEWYQAATVKLANPQKGLRSVSRLDYVMDYVANWDIEGLKAGEASIDNRALSVCYPTDFASHGGQSWPSFLLDLMPQGPARRRIAEALGFNNSHDPAVELPLLLRGSSSPKGIDLIPKPGYGRDYFTFDSKMEMLTSRPPMNPGDMMRSFGPTDYLMKQSILPVVAWPAGGGHIKCIGTAFVVSCSGYIVTAAHVLLDPQESGYGKVTADDGVIQVLDDTLLGVTIPVSPASGLDGFQIVPIQQSWYWGTWVESPLIHEQDRFNGTIDVAVCKLPPLPGNAAYQPLNLSLRPFIQGEDAYAIGYAEMKDIPIEYIDGVANVPDFDPTLFVSVGEVMNVFPHNAVERQVPTPGPCFDFRAKVPGRMSGAPIFGAKGAVVRGVVSRSFTDEKHAFGCMMGPAMTLKMTDQQSLQSLMKEGNEGIAVVQGQGL